MDVMLQLWGGLFYLANKITFSIAEGRRNSVKRKLRIIGWVIYILGVPAWVTILILKRNWIAASIEAGGLPSMIFGLVNDIQNEDKPDKGLDRIASLFTYTFILLGAGISIYDFGGIKTLSQFLEIGVTIGFLMGSLLLARKKPSGWGFFMLMNSSMGILMLIQKRPLLAAQQLLSLGFVIYGFISARNKMFKQSA
ncbi:MAG: nicotinamide mononucleotide transporter [Spirochaetales bacterium]|uniref:Nicotinamide mononucleotide transporter n=1 Tax=Candidatus Thalassospirochaeta sargassi TaxID=3119039 RepID=A0AAJ1IB45_9SPIO|nr:nicotinamide mononucleotide transporter [Spirochaetales bacterium]